MTRADAPKVLPDRTAARIAAALDARRSGYVPAWRAQTDAGTALHAVLGAQLAALAAAVNAAPQALQLQFLEQNGATVLPAQPARAPIVFTLLDNASIETTVPAGCRLGAVLPPATTPGSATATTATAVPPAPEFFTEQQITAMRGRVGAFYSIDPQADAYTDHSAATPGDFTVFAAQAPVPHRLYLGHAALLALSGDAQVELAVTFGVTPEGAAPPRPLLLDWEYLSTDGWLPLRRVNDGTARFTRDGAIELAKPPGPDSRSDVVGGLTSCWIRATVAARTPAARIVATSPAHDTLGGVTVQTEDGLELDTGDVVTVDGSTRATVLQRFGTSLRLDTLPDGSEPGAMLVLADALPPLRPEGPDTAGVLPQLDVVRVRSGVTQGGLVLDRAALDGFALDISKDFFPFGEQPRAFAACYLACKAAFTRTGARVTLSFTYSQVYADYADGTAKAPTMAAEYTSGGRWLPLGSQHEYADGTAALTAESPEGSGTAALSFIVPEGWDDAEVNGDKQRWLRLRLAKGDYGKPLAIKVDVDADDPSVSIVTTTPSSLRPPVIADVTASYQYLTHPEAPDACVTENDFAFVDHSEDARWPRRPFAPFTPVSDLTPAVHVGFTLPPPAGLVSLLVHVLEPALAGDPQPYAWDYWGSRGWTGLSVRDTTAGLRRTGLVQFVGAPDAVARDGLGGALYRIRARLKSGLASTAQQFRCGGLWLNAVWASHGTRVERATLGTSNGEPDQTFALVPRGTGASTSAPAVTTAADASAFDRVLDTVPVGVPVHDGEQVEVREWTGRGDGWQALVAGVATTDLRFEFDPRDATVVTAVWVRWTPQPNLYRSGPQDRHYSVERATGIFRFPGVAGRVPAAGNTIVVSYVTGGGVAGNVPADSIRELRSSVGLVQSVRNPLPAEGGAEAESLRGARDRGAASLQHRDRAVAASDYAWLARSASAEVARARAQPLDGPDGAGSRGFVTVVIVPRSTAPQPQPSAQLVQTVLGHVAGRVPAGIAGGVRVIGPEYVAASVRIDLQPAIIEDAAAIEAQVRTRLAQFLHPLDGGADGRGWDFGASLHLSDVAACVAGIDGVAAVQLLQLLVGGAISGEVVAVAPHQLLCAGDLQVRVVVPTVPYALA